MRRIDEERYKKAKNIFDAIESPTEKQKELFMLCQKAYDYLRKYDTCTDFHTRCDDL